MKKIFLDMDGTFVDLYGVENWLPDLIAGCPRPYQVAKPLCSMCWLARTIHELQAVGYEVGVISWTAKNATQEYNELVRQAKLEWLAEHLPSVRFDSIQIIEYGTPKSICGCGYLFDDEERNRQEWDGVAFDVIDLIKTLRGLI